MSKMLRKITIGVLSILVLGIAPFGWSQSNNASIDGEITDPGRAVVRGAQVVVASKDKQETSNFVSDANGYYSFRNVLPGKYQLTIAAQGFGQYVQDGILVCVGY